jgi:hypothetical protein
VGTIAGTTNAAYRTRGSSSSIMTFTLKLMLQSTGRSFRLWSSDVRDRDRALHRWSKECERRLKLIQSHGLALPQSKTPPSVTKALLGILSLPIQESFINELSHLYSPALPSLSLCLKYHLLASAGFTASSHFATCDATAARVAFCSTPTIPRCMRYLSQLTQIYVMAHFTTTVRKRSFDLPGRSYTL